MTTRAPNLMIPGTIRSGTTSLYSYLALHPDVCPSRIKEPNYFSPLRFGLQPGPWKDYLRHFEHCRGERYRLEATAGYLYGGADVAAAVRDRLESVKLLVMIREPFDHLVSWFRFRKSRFMVDYDLSLEEFVKACLALSTEERRTKEKFTYFGVDSGYYADFLQPWLETFGSDLKVLFLEDLRRSRRDFLEQVCSWLDLDPSVYSREDLSVENKSSGFRSTGMQKLALWINDTGETFWRRNPQLKRRLRRIYYSVNGRPFREAIPEAVRAELMAHYAPQNARLADLLQAHGYVHLPDWLQRDAAWESTP